MLYEDRLLTLEEYEALPSDPYYEDELSRGRVVREPPAGDEHGRVVPRVVLRLGSYLESHPEIGELRADSGFILSEHPATVRGPDVAVVFRENLPELKPRSFFVGAPDIAIEVVSPSNSAGNMQAKVLEYLEAGTRLIWVLYPQTRTAVEHLADGTIRLLIAEQALQTELLPGFGARLSEFFD